MRNQSEPIVIHKLGSSGRVMETFFGILREDKPFIIKEADSLDDLMRIVYGPKN